MQLDKNFLRDVVFAELGFSRTSRTDMPEWRGADRGYRYLGDGDPLASLDLLLPLLERFRVALAPTKSEGHISWNATAFSCSGLTVRIVGSSSEPPMAAALCIAQCLGYAVEDCFVKEDLQEVRT